MINKISPALVVALVCCGAFDASAAIVTIGASRDATIFQNNPDNGSGAGNGLFAGTNGMGSPRRGLIAFDVAGSLPAHAVVQDVQLTLVLGQVAGGGMGGGAGGPMVGLHRLEADWGEGTTQQSQPPSDALGGQGQGAAAAAGDVTWNSRFHGSTPATPWSAPGGDFIAASAATAVGTTINTSFSWGATPALVSDVQGWLSDPASNFGWILVNADEVNATTFRAFYSRNVATASFRPQLSITYVPEASGFALGMGLWMSAAMIRCRALPNRARSSCSGAA